MSTNFPTSLNSFTRPTSTSQMNDSGVEGDVVIDNLYDSVEALEAKVGINSSAVTSSLDYKVTNTSSSNPGHKHTLANGASDVTASVAEVNKMDGVTSTAAELNITDAGDTTEKVLNVQCKARAYTSGDQSVNNTTYTKISFDTESYDIGSDFDHATNYKFVTPVTGYYLIIAQLEWVSIADAKLVQTFIYIDSTSAIVGKSMTGASENPTSLATDVQYIVAGKDIEIYGYHNHGAARDVNANSKATYFAVHLMSI